MSNNKYYLIMFLEVKIIYMLKYLNNKNRCKEYEGKNSKSLILLFFRIIFHR